MFSIVTKKPTCDLVGVHEIADLLGVSRQRVDQLARDHDAFPEPVAELHMGRIWRRDDIEQWQSTRAR